MIASLSRSLGALAAALACLMGGLACGQASSIGQWSAVQDWPIEAIHGVLLPNGKMMLWQSWTTSSVIWDPSDGGFEDANFPSYNIFCSGHAWLPDGRLLVVGGQRPQGNNWGEPRADIYDPATNTWASQDPNVPDVPNMNLGRWYPSATTLGNGDVLVMSGNFAPDGNNNQLPQIYEHETNTWRSLTSAQRTLPLYPRTFLAPDGRAVVVSDYGDDTEYLDLSGTGSWEFIDETLDNNLHNYGPAVMYDAGKIAQIGGGHNPTQNISILDLNDANPQWRYGADDMAQPRRQNDATILADGTVLITGGTSVEGWNDPAGAISVAEIWDPVTEQVTQVAEGSDIYRGYHTTATLLHDGRVLITGGDHDHGGSGPFTSNRNAEIYEPAYLHNGPRPTISDSPATASHGQTFLVETPDTNIERALMVVPGSTTHAQNWTQRANRLEVTQAEGGVQITIPSNPNKAPPGNYMLFLVNDNGVPSIAENVQVVPGLDGDYNFDGLVNAADYTVWRDTYLSLGEGLAADGNGDEFVGNDDYQLWADHYAATPGVSLSVPEPTAALLWTLAAAAIILKRRPVGTG